MNVEWTELRWISLSVIMHNDVPVKVSKKLKERSDAKQYSVIGTEQKVLKQIFSNASKSVRISVGPKKANGRPTCDKHKNAPTLFLAAKNKKRMEFLVIVFKEIRDTYAFVISVNKQ